MITIADIPATEFEFSAIRSSGPGGQHVNKVSSAIQLRFNIDASSLPASIKHRLKSRKDTRVTADGIVVIKAQEFRSQERNRQAALDRLNELLIDAQRTRKPRRPTRPTKASVRKRLNSKKKQGDRKKLRGKVDY